MVDTALTTAGYACVEFCTQADRDRGAYASWRRPDGLLIVNATVFSAASRQPDSYDTIGDDRSRDTHIDLEVTIS